MASRSHNPRLIILVHILPGSRVWSSPRSIVAFMRQANIVNYKRHSPIYELRLAKYHLRGYECYYPGFDWSRDRLERAANNGPSVGVQHCINNGIRSTQSLSTRSRLVETQKWCTKLKESLCFSPLAVSSRGLGGFMTRRQS